MFKVLIIFKIKIKEAATAIHRSQYETQFDVKLETNNDKVVIVKEKKMSERKRR